MKPLLSFEQMKKRLQWCTEMASKDWNSVIFTDESTFVLKKYKRKFWDNSRMKRIIRTIKHPPKIHVCGCFSAHGFGKLYFFTGTLTVEKMNIIYEKKLLPSVRKFGFHDRDDR